MPQLKSAVCAECQGQTPSFGALRSWSAFEGPLRNILRRLKYRRDLSLGDALAAPSSSFVAGLNWKPDPVILIPLSRKRLAERGYNQVGVVARPLSMATGLPCAPRAIVRERETRTRVGLTAAERKDNVRGVFRARGSTTAGRTVQLLDDVATTGATLSSAAEALPRGGASRVVAVTLARALLRHGLGLG